MKTPSRIKLDAKHVHGFTLVEFIGILTIIGILAGISFIPLLGVIRQARMRAETTNLNILGREIKASFRQDNLDSLNISSFADEVPLQKANVAPGTPVATTIFDDAAADVFQQAAWYARLARARGIDTSTISGDLDSLNGDIHNLTHNAYNKRRILLAAPRKDGDTAERYILLSFMFNDGPRVPIIPTGGDAYADWFNNVYNFDWGRADGAPDGWTGWGARESNGYSYAQRVVAERITQPRYYLTIQNTNDANTGDHLFCYSNMDGSDIANALLYDEYVPSPANSPVPSFPRVLTRGILEGRRVIVKRGATPDTSREIYSFLLNENTTITSQ